MRFGGDSAGLAGDYGNGPWAQVYCIIIAGGVDSGRLALLAMMKPVRHAETRWKCFLKVSERRDDRNEDVA